MIVSDMITPQDFEKKKMFQDLSTFFFYKKEICQKISLRAKSVLIFPFILAKQRYKFISNYIFSNNFGTGGQKTDLNNFKNACNFKGNSTGLTMQQQFLQYCVFLIQEFKTRLKRTHTYSAN